MGSAAPGNAKDGLYDLIACDGDTACSVFYADSECGGSFIGCDLTVADADVTINVFTGQAGASVSGLLVRDGAVIVWDSNQVRDGDHWSESYKYPLSNGMPPSNHVDNVAGATASFGLERALQPCGNYVCAAVPYHQNADAQNYLVVYDGDLSEVNRVPNPAGATNSWGHAHHWYTYSGGAGVCVGDYDSENEQNDEAVQGRVTCYECADPATCTLDTVTAVLLPPTASYELTGCGFRAIHAWHDGGTTYVAAGCQPQGGAADGGWIAGSFVQ